MSGLMDRLILLQSFFPRKLEISVNYLVKWFLKKEV